ncbi:LPXTG cell wall anchor domain-containing protein [Bacillus infantis]|uniref:LPXTG cell wall anchor domain-containing protein n=1 Tax=Bacillus infantis TaxID=324767 RepID=UPI00101BDDB3|nr:LPXTG cell wall anchor domain-containing protein [Bacillus infantis]RYI25793.1 LPXTG cell wall anchor domain-containing protein [Bacillus infantis]
MSTKKLLAKPKALFILTLLILIIFPHNQVQAEDKEIDIVTNPSGYFFKVGNLKPGDWMPRDITISNNGKQDFKYTSIIGKKKSVKGLFEELELLVKKDSATLYEGKMKDFEGFTPRPLKKDQSETLFFQVTMPYDLGNAFQDSSAEVEILFVAEALDGDEDPPGGDNPGDGDPPGGGEPPDDGEPPGEDNPGDGEDPGEDNPGEDPGDNPGDEHPPGEDNPDDGDNGEDPGDGETEDPGEDNPSEDPNDDSGDPSDNPDEPASGNPGSNPGDGITVTPEIRENILPDTATNTYNFMLLGGILLGAGGILLAVRYHRIRKDH